MHTHKHVYNYIYLYSAHYDHQNTTLSTSSVCILTLHQNWPFLAQCVPALDMEVGREGIVGFWGQRQNLLGNINK